MVLVQSVVEIMLSNVASDREYLYHLYLSYVSSIAHSIRTFIPVPHTRGRREERERDFNRDGIYYIQTSNFTLMIRIEFEIRQSHNKR